MQTAYQNGPLVPPDPASEFALWELQQRMQNISLPPADGFYARAARHTGPKPYCECTAGAEWHPSPGTTQSFKGGPFTDYDECRAFQKKTLLALGYTKPRWWQYWRWGECRYNIG